MAETLIMHQCGVPLGEPILAIASFDMTSEYSVSDDDILRALCGSDSVSSRCKQNNDKKKSIEGDASSEGDEFYIDDDDELSSQISFLRAKQLLLHRASSVFAAENAYDSANARIDAEGAPPDAEDSLWNVAKEYLEMHCCDDDDLLPGREERSPEPCTTVSAARKSVATKPSETRRKRRSSEIDMSQVACETSNAYHRANASMSNCDVRYDINQQALAPTGPWIAQALIASTRPSATASRDGGPPVVGRVPTAMPWGVLSDPRSSSSGLIPPINMSFRNSISLQEAIAITWEARLVCQSTPPFVIVHVNKAFLNMIGIHSNAHLIGKPVESVLRKSKQVCGMGANTKLDQDDDLVWTDIVLSSSQKKIKSSCCCRVVPIVDRSKHGRLEKEVTSNQKWTSACMSHIMVHVVADTETQKSSVKPTSGERASQITDAEDSFASDRQAVDLSLDLETVFGMVG